MIDEAPALFRGILRRFEYVEADFWGALGAVLKGHPLPLEHRGIHWSSKLGTLQRGKIHVEEASHRKLYGQ